MIITCPNCSTRYSLPQDKIKPEGQKVRCAKCGTVWHQEPEEEPLALTTEEIVPAAPAPAPAWAATTPAEAVPAVEPTASPAAEAPAPDATHADTAEPAAAAPDAAVAAAEAAVVTPGIRPDSFANFHVPADAADEPTGAGRKIAVAVVIVVVAVLGALIAFKQQVQDLTGIQLVSTQAAPPAAPAAAPQAPAKPKAPEPLTLTFEEVESSIEEIDGIKRLLVKGVIVNPADHEQLVPPLAFNMLDKDGKPIDRWSFAAPVRALAPHTTTRFASQRDTPPSTLHELVPGFDVPENPPPVIEPPAATGTPTPGTPAASATTRPPATAPAKPSAVPTTATPQRPPASQQTPGPTE